MRPSANRSDIFDRLNLTRAAVMCVFEADEPSADKMIIFGPNQSAELIDVQDAAFAFDRFGNDSAELGERPLLIVVNVTAGLADELVARLAVNAHADLVRHRS